VSSRKRFLSAIASATAALTLTARKGGAQPSPVPRASALPAAAASPNASPSPKPSEAALATAALMRAFDSKLSEAELRTIAGNIDSNRKEGRTLNRGKRRLKNSDEPVTTFRVPQ